LPGRHFGQVALQGLGEGGEVAHQAQMAAWVHGSKKPGCRPRDKVFQQCPYSMRAFFVQRNDMCEIDKAEFEAMVRRQEASEQALKEVREDIRQIRADTSGIVDFFDSA